MKEYIEERAIELAHFIIENKSTVRAAAKKFGISKSTVHTVLRIGVGCTGCLSTPPERMKCIVWNDSR
ncbi:MAG: sporulation transcriptional regulator SpoIIID [Firmicutes bacterium]|nr:sporulation transcriptional regulator SpoIIID [Bacillota bacterium]